MEEIKEISFIAEKSKWEINMIETKRLKVYAASKEQMEAFNIASYMDAITRL